MQRQAATALERKSGKGAPGRTHASAPPMLAAPQSSCACGGGCPRCRGKYPLQAKLDVSQPGDTLEQEADRVAEQVLRMPQPELPDNPGAHKNSGLRVSRYSFGPPARGSPEVAPTVHNVVRSPGEPLDPATRAFMEPRFGHDFSQVRVHSGAAAEQSAQDVNASAYTVGHEIVFGAGRFAPQTNEGRRLLAHELTHVVQQHVATQGAPTLQRKGQLTGTNWRNAVIEGVNRIQEVIRTAQADKKGRIELDILIEPDFVGVHSHQASGTASTGDVPDGLSVYKAAEQAVSRLVDEAPSSRRVYTVVLERTSTGWDRLQFTHTGETHTLDDADQQSASGAAWTMANQLDLAHAAGRGAVRFQVAMSDSGVKIVSWQATGTAQKSNKVPPTTAATKSFEGFTSVMGSRVLIYEITHKLDAGAWRQDSYNLLGEVKPIEPVAEGAEPSDSGMDEGEMAIEDVRAARRLVLTTAAMLIAEQDPTRLDNLIYSVGPFAVLGVLKAGKLAKLAKLGKLSKIFGRPAIRVFGETKFRGLIQSRPLRELTDNEITHAFTASPFKLSNHANKQLRALRTADIGVETLDDVAKVLNDGIIQATKKAEDANEVIEIAGRSMKAVVNVETNVIISFVPL